MPEKIHPRKSRGMVVVRSIPPDLHKINGKPSGTNRELFPVILDLQVVEALSDSLRRNSVLKKIIDPVRLTVRQKTAAAALGTGGVVPDSPRVCTSPGQRNSFAVFSDENWYRSVSISPENRYGSSARTQV